MNPSQLAIDAKEKLLNDLREVIAQAEQLLSDTEQQSERGYKTAVAQFERKVKNARRELSHLEQRISSSGIHAVRSTERFVEDHPWQAVSAGLCAGVLVGMLMARK
jgi:ElaB/YqjD/DUF883 family membrane-anchored ribosome-binding protein